MSVATLDLDSTLIRRAVTAATFNEMAQFASTVENRPLDKLLAELPVIAALSDMKFSLARQVIRRRVRELAEADREQLRVFAEEIAANAPAVVASRIRELFT